MRGVKIEWTQEMDDKLREEFPLRITKDICDELGVSLRSAIRRARVLGIEKDARFFDVHRKEITKRATKSLKERVALNGSWGFQKGQRPYPDGEFKPGHKEDPETKKKRIEKMQRTRRQMIFDERVRLKYGLKQRTKLRLKLVYNINKIA